MYRTESTLAAAAIVLTFAIAGTASAQQRGTPAINIRPVVGVIVGTGEQQDALESAVLIGAQASYAVHHNVSVVGSFGWSPSREKLSAQQPRLDLYQYDLGIEGRLDDLTPSARVITRPYAVVGAGGRTYDLRDVPSAGAQASALAYGAVGMDVNHADGRFGLRLEARDNVTAFGGFRGEFAERKARNDLQLSAGITLGL